jgi:hypothetical protein
MSHLQPLRSAARLLTVALLFAAAPLAARAADLCNLLTTAEISAATGDPVTTTSPGPSNCTWHGKASAVYLTIRDSSGWATGKSMMLGSGNATATSGVGTDAFFLNSGAQPFLYALKGSHFIILRVNVTKFSKDQNEAAAKALATSALSRL